MNIKSFIREHYVELMELLNCVKVGIYIADGEGNTILLNDESAIFQRQARHTTRGLRYYN